MIKHFCDVCSTEIKRTHGQEIILSSGMVVEVHRKIFGWMGSSEMSHSFFACSECLSKELLSYAKEVAYYVEHPRTPIPSISGYSPMPRKEN